MPASGTCRSTRCSTRRSRSTWRAGELGNGARETPMPLTLYVDGERWRAHLHQVRDAHPGIVPVLKGNGYGFGIERLASRSAWLGVDTVAAGTYGEVAAAAEGFCGASGGSVMVLSPWRAFETRAVFEPHVIHT